MSFVGSPLVRKLVGLAIEEDLAFGDITASLTVPATERSTARIIARQELVVCGLDILPVIIEEGRFDITYTRVADEGALVSDKAPLCELSGPSQHLLALERTALNFLQRLSGVATFTRNFCGHAGKLQILDTRKTMPGWRVLDKYATRIGGARNHRASLGDMVLVKNNHIDAHPGGMRGALASIVQSKPLYMPWEVEVRDLSELSIALEFKPTIIMLDNFSDDLIKEALTLVSASAHRPVVEVSGGVKPERLHVLAALGVDAASVGALTTQAPNVDISMRIAKA
jgi:nicotinate-nucleotide pyrophosphorylase (carboxylating)